MSMFKGLFFFEEMERWSRSVMIGRLCEYEEITGTENCTKKRFTQ